MRAHRSHSQLNNYLHCGHQYYLTRVRRYKEQPSVWLAGGKAFHTATEEFDLDVASSDDQTPAGANITFYEDKFTDAFEAELDLIRKDFPDESTWRAAGRVTKDKPNKENVLWWHTAGRTMIRDYIAWWVANAEVWEVATLPDGRPAIEIEVTQPLGGVPLKGYLDRLLRSKLDSRLVVADLKSGSRTPASPMQLATYSVQLEPLLGGEQVLWGAWYDARKGSLGEPVNLSKWTEGLLGKVYGDLDRAIGSGVFLPNIDDHCKGCGVAKFCVYNGGREEEFDLAA